MAAAVAVAAGTAQVERCGTGDLTEATNRSVGHPVGVMQPRVEMYSEWLTEYTAALRTHGKIIETVVEIAWNMALARFRPNDSYEFHDLAKDWAAEFESLYDVRVASSEWAGGVWRERCDTFAQEKIEETVMAGLGYILVADDP